MAGECSICGTTIEESERVVFDHGELQHADCATGGTPPVRADDPSGEAPPSVPPAPVS
jgi:hypothetical protein